MEWRVFVGSLEDQRRNAEASHGESHDADRAQLEPRSRAVVLRWHVPWQHGNDPAKPVE